MELYVYRFHLRALGSVRFPDFPGHPVRGGWKEAHRSLVCAYPERTGCSGCMLEPACSYPHLWSPTAELLGSPDLKKRGFGTPPLPLMIRPRFQAGTYGAGSLLEIELTVVCEAHRHFLYLRTALDALGRRAIGTRRRANPGDGRFRVERVEAVEPDGVRTLAFSSRTGPVTGRPWRFPEDFAGPQQEQQEVWDAGELVLEFPSPTYVGGRRPGCDEDLGFDAVVRSILDNLAVLGTAYGDGPPLTADEERNLLERAASVRVSVDATEWEDVPWRSSVQGREMPWEGWRGRVRYSGDLGPFLPLLRVAELIHVGKRAGYGWGQVRLLLERQAVELALPAHAGT